MNKTPSGFTLIELLVTISIIILLVGLIAPNLGRIRAKADSIKCANNLRQIGIAVNSYAADNDNTFPVIQSDDMPVYPAGFDPAPKPILETLSPYGITQNVLKCPADASGYNYFAKDGSSYQWLNYVDDEKTAAPKVYTRRGVRLPRLSWIRIAIDYENVHNNHANRLYADGHVLSQ